LAGKKKRDKHDKRPAQQDLARKLRELRVVNGFKTARSFARHVGIDENRYTRYERAAAEPDITLIRIFAAALKTTPSDLLGTRQPNGFVEEASVDLGPMSGSGLRVSSSQALAWALAEAVTDLKVQPSSSSANIRWRRLQAVSALYEQLLANPLGMIAALTQDAALSTADPGVVERIEELIASLRRAAP
jgi:transcriptional regulator with XRE-family HTH domain